jgi:hypothetical protein
MSGSNTRCLTALASQGLCVQQTSVAIWCASVGVINLPVVQLDDIFQLAQRDELSHHRMV